MPCRYKYLHNMQRAFFGLKGEHLKQTEIYTSFIFPMINVTILGVFCTHVQKEYGKVLMQIISTAECSKGSILQYF